MHELLKKESVKRVNQFIKSFDKKLEIKILNKTAKTAKEAADTLNSEVGAIVKSLLLRTEHSFLLCLVAGDKKCSLNKIKKILNKKDVSMASAEEVKINTGFSIGGVSPVGHITKLPVFIDLSLSRFKDLFAAAGHPNCVFSINYDDLIKITKGLEKEISE
tara:strand:- start:228 stop:710 length:483 start_codon:yes stop_codon:yes gene_type:complete